MFSFPQKITTIIPNFCEDLEYLGDTTVTITQFDLNKTDDDNDNSNYDSALENEDQDKSKKSTKEKDTIELERSNKMVESLGVGLLVDGGHTDVVNANNSLASVSEIVNSMNRLNIEFFKDSTR
jgi:hypothetical protein